MLFILKYTAVLIIENIFFCHLIRVMNHDWWSKNNWSRSKFTARARMRLYALRI